jgi:DNA topoisomerase-1
VFNIGLNRAVTLIAEKIAQGPGRGRFKADPGKPLGDHPDGGVITVKNGRYGPYVSHEGTNATLPGDKTPDTITLAEAIALIDERAARGGGKAKRAGKKKPAAKTSAAKKTAAKATPEAAPAAARPAAKAKAAKPKAAKAKVTKAAKSAKPKKPANAKSADKKSAKAAAKANARSPAAAADSVAATAPAKKAAGKSGG